MKEAVQEAAVVVASDIVGYLVAVASNGHMAANSSKTQLYPTNKTN